MESLHSFARRVVGRIGDLPFEAVDSADAAVLPGPIAAKRGDLYLVLVGFSHQDDDGTDIYSAFELRSLTEEAAEEADLVSAFVRREREKHYLVDGEQVVLAQPSSHLLFAGLRVGEQRGMETDCTYVQRIQ